VSGDRALTLGELIHELTALRDAEAGSATWVVEMDIGPVDLPVRRVDNYWGPHDEDPGRVVLA